jgi:hypothetical protein
MIPDRVFVEAIKVAQDLLRQNLPPMRNLTDAATVLRLRDLVRSPSIRSALDGGSDTLVAFAWRAVERALCDHSRPHRETIELLWDVLDEPHLNKALGTSGKLLDLAVGRMTAGAMRNRAIRAMEADAPA